MTGRDGASSDEGERAPDAEVAAADVVEPSLDPRLRRAREELLEGVGAEIAASFPGITRLGGQVVAALYMSDGPRSMDELAHELGRSKSNIFGNLRGLEAAGIVERRREARSRNDVYALRGKYPDVIVGAYLGRLRRVVRDKVELTDRALGILGDASGPEADALRARLVDLERKYRLFGRMMDMVLGAFEGPVDLERVLGAIPDAVVKAVELAARATLGSPKGKP